MSTSQKLLIASGVFTVVSIVAIAAFSLGVYVGERGWTAGPPAMAGPGGALPKGPAGGPDQPGQQPPGGGLIQQPPGGQPGQPPGGGPGQQPLGGQPGQSPGGAGLGQSPFGLAGDLPTGRPDVIGRVRSVDDDNITLDTPQGSRLVMVNEETEVRLAEGEKEVNLEYIEPDMHIAVFGQFNGEGKTLVAQMIVILPSSPER